MKKLNLLFLLFVGVLGMSVMTSCNPDSTTDDVKPSMTFSSDGAGITGNVTVSPLTPLLFKISAIENPNTKKNLQTLRVQSFSNNASVKDTAYTINDDSYLISLNYNATSFYSTEEKFTFTLTDKAGEVATKTITVTTEAAPVVATDLDAEVAFSWSRCGSTETDISSFGLDLGTYQITGNVFIILADGDKLVELSSSQWTSITTKEALQEAVDNGTGVSDIDDIVWTTGTNTYDVVLATKVGSEYHLINITQGVSTSETCGTQVVLTGNTKK